MPFGAKGHHLLQRGDRIGQPLLLDIYDAPQRLKP
jgi:hypothetical protein